MITKKQQKNDDSTAAFHVTSTDNDKTLPLSSTSATVSPVSRKNNYLPIFIFLMNNGNTINTFFEIQPQLLCTPKRRRSKRVPKQGKKQIDKKMSKTSGFKKTADDSLNSKPTNENYFSDIISDDDVEDNDADSDIEIIEVQTTVIEIDDEESMNPLDITLKPTDRTVIEKELVISMKPPGENSTNQQIEKESLVLPETSETITCANKSANKTNPWLQPIQCTLISSCIQTKTLFSNIDNKTKKKTSIKKKSATLASNESAVCIPDANIPEQRKAPTAPVTNTSTVNIASAAGTVSNNIASTSTLSVTSTTQNSSTTNSISPSFSGLANVSPIKTSEPCTSLISAKPSEINTLSNSTSSSSISANTTDLPELATSLPNLESKNTTVTTAPTAATTTATITATTTARTTATTTATPSTTTTITLGKTSQPGVFIINETPLFFKDRRGATENEVRHVPLYDSISSEDSFFDKTLTPTSGRQSKRSMPTIDLSDSISIDNQIMPSPSVKRKRKKLDDSVVFVSESILSTSEALDFIPIPKVYNSDNQPRTRNKSKQLQSRKQTPPKQNPKKSPLSKISKNRPG